MNIPHMHERGKTRSAYVAGPMTGLPNFNFDVFDEVTALLRKLSEWGPIVNPAERDRLLYDITAPGFTEGDVKVWSEATGFDYHQAMRFDLATITRSDAIVLLPGWENSTGANNEKFVADCCGLEVWFAYKPTDRQGWTITQEYQG